MSAYAPYEPLQVYVGPRKAVLAAHPHAANFPGGRHARGPWLVWAADKFGRWAPEGSGPKAAEALLASYVARHPGVEVVRVS